MSSEACRCRFARRQGPGELPRLHSLAPGATVDRRPRAASDRLRDAFDIDDRQRRQVVEIDRHNQRILAESPYVRDAFFGKLDTSSLAAFSKRPIEPYRADLPRRRDRPPSTTRSSSADPRTRKVYDDPEASPATRSSWTFTRT